MTHEEFNTLISTYGAKSERWPEDIQRSANVYISEHPETAQSVLRAAMALDAALDSVSPPPPSDLLKARILKTATNAAIPAAAAPQAVNDRAPAPRWRSIAAMVMVAFGAGFGGAHLVTPQSPVAPQTDIVVNETTDDWQLVAEDLGFSDIYTWVEGDAETNPASDL